MPLYKKNGDVFIQLKVHLELIDFSKYGYYFFIKSNRKDAI